MQKRRGLDDEEGGESDIPPARTQSFSNPARDFALNAVRNPFATAMILSTSSEGSGGMGVRTRHLKHIVVKAVRLSPLWLFLHFFFLSFFPSSFFPYNNDG